MLTNILMINNLVDRISYYFIGRHLPREKIALGLFGMFWVAFVFLILATLIIYMVRRKIFEHYNQRQIKIIIFLLFFIVGIATSFWVINFNPSGDEPYYLLSVHSLVKDGDLNCYNNILNKDWVKFYKGEFDIPLTSKMIFSRGQERFCFYLPGLGSVLAIAPGYALAWRMGTLFTTVLAGAFILVNIYICSLALVKNRESAFIGALLVGFSAPIFCYSQQNYPDIFAALLIILAIKNIFFMPYLNIRSCIIAGLCTGLLPVFHLKYAPDCLALLAIALYLRKRLSLRIYTLLPVIIIFLLYAIFFKFGLKVFSPLNFYRSGSGEASISAAIPYVFQPFVQLIRGSFLGLLFDQEFGLFIYAPVYLTLGLGISIFIKLFKRTRYMLILSFILIHYVFISCINGWWAGEFVRYLVSIIPITGIFIALAISRCRDRLFRKTLFVLSGISFFITFLVTFWPDFRYALNTGENIILRKLNTPVFRITDFLPSFTVVSYKSWVLVLVYLMVIIVFTVYAYKKSNLQIPDEKNIA